MVAKVSKTIHDYIIVGAGSAGCVVANRLTQNPDCTVLLIEAGGPDRNPLVRLPMMMGKLFNSGIYNWSYYTEPVEYLNDRSLFWPRGKVLGGSSTINGMIYIRGNSHDFDRWAQSGLPRWSYENVLKSYMRSENHCQRQDNFHGKDGELAVCRARGSNELFDIFIQAGRQAGYPVNDDFNGEDQEGFGRFDFTIKNGKRCSTATAFLKPIMHRSNLSIMTNTHVNRVVIKKGRATGIEIMHGSNIDVLPVNKEIIICAGTVNSPQILMLSGVGPEDEMQEYGIKVVHPLGGVGKNLQDHVDCVLAYECTKPITLFNALRADRLAWSVINGIVAGKGTATTFPYEAGAFVKSTENLVAPDIQLHFMPALEKTANLHFPALFKSKSKEIDHGFSIRVGPINPDSRGSIKLRSTNPKEQPAIHPNYLASKSDRDKILAGIRIVRDVIGQGCFDDYRGMELSPGSNIRSDDELLLWLRSAAMTTFHPVGTCRMGNDSMAVVDEELRVHGISGLRIADASVMPVITSGNTNAPSIMIGEQLATFMTGN